ncbi:MAG: cyclic nucleotide-binding domain-containing protein [Verrucomicrobia bacterium]|nr:cyclic nucleotide-binding domain-containing protein [Verrucomicrobiota bacterium]
MRLSPCSSVFISFMSSPAAVLTFSNSSVPNCASSAGSRPWIAFTTTPQGLNAGHSRLDDRAPATNLGTFKHAPPPTMTALEKSRLFSELFSTELKLLEQTAQLKSFKAGQVVFREGDPGDGLYVVQSGLVSISATVHEQERRVLTRITTGDYFGEMSLLDSESRSATAMAEQDTEALFIARPDLLKLLDQSPKLGVSLLREFSQRIREVNRQYIREVLQAERLTLVGRFARTIVHDFKTPLNIISLASELACMEMTSPANRKVAHKRIYRQVLRLTSMMHELLEFTRGTPSGMVLEAMDYGQYIHALAEELKVELLERKVQLELASEPPSVQVQLAPKRINHLFFNLLNNAVDAMAIKRGGRISLRVSTDGKEVITEVEDTGPGIAPEVASRLFEPFATFGKEQGTGLGLSICRKIVEDHGGRIWTRSEAGRGAIFVIALPVYK